MKKILISLSVLIAVLSSCTKDFVTVTHNSQEPYSEYFISEARAYEALVAAYGPLQWLDYFNQYTPLNMISDIMADDMYKGGETLEADCVYLKNIHLYTLSPLEGQLPNMLWTTCYSGINRSCQVLENVDPVPNMSDQTKALYKAEANVLKAFYYTILWKFWGNIPYYDVNLTAPYIAPQLTADQVYTNIVTKLEEVFEANVLPMKAPGGQEGHVTKAMAYMLYAEAVMYQCDESRYAKALEYMEEIIGSGNYDLVADFASIWEESGEWCNESIWEINYTSQDGVRSWSNPLASGGTVMPKFIGINAFPDSDDYEYDPGWGFAPIPQHVYDMFDDADQRKEATILNWNTYLKDHPKATYTPRAQDTGNFLRKYIARNNGNHGQKADADLNHHNNYRVYRFAETLLNAAELSLLTGKDGSQYLQRVRQRAGCTDAGTDQEAIIAERRKEFVGEGKRYWDLVRTGMASTVLKADNHEYREKDWTPNLKYWPIPQPEMDKDPNLVQNNY
jgi:hypothetical protein